LARRATSSSCLIALAPLLAACASATTSSPVGASTVELRPVIDFAFDSLDARPVSADATRGKTTVLVFVTTGSLPAQAQIDFLVPMAQHDGDSVNYAAVALAAGPEGRELVELYRRSLHVPFPVAMADGETLQGQGPFGDMSAMPVTVVLDRTGRIVWRSAGRVVKSTELRSAMRGL
jgi:hypothetical protein